MAISIENAWWDEGGLWEDPDLQKVKNSLLKFHPRPISIDECRQPGVLTIRGPRRVGKTVALKLLVAELIANDVFAPKDILWTSFDTVGTLARAEEFLYALVRKHKPRILFIDEVTSILHWQKLIKKIIDDGTLAKCSCILTGSSAYDLKKGSERLAGRKGENYPSERALLPMPFHDFFSQWKNHDRSIDEKRAFSTYLAVGGFPFRVEEFLKSFVAKTPYDGFPSLSVFDDTVFYEIARRRLDRGIAIEVLARIANVGSAAISYEGFARPLGVARETARTYLDALGDGFLLATLSAFDTSRNRVAPKKDRKLMWIDPALSDLPAFIRQAEPTREADKVEWLVGVELLRRFESRIWEGLSAPRNVFTWKSSSGKEIDFLIVDKSKKLRFPIEVKYQDEISDWDFQVIEKAFGKGVLITKHSDRERACSKAMSVVSFLSGREWMPKNVNP